VPQLTGLLHRSLVLRGLLELVEELVEVLAVLLVELLTRLAGLVEEVRDVLLVHVAAAGERQDAADDERRHPGA
jgi:hypothetical protein